MNRQNFEAKDRFPLSTQSLTFMQDMVMAASRLALIGGENYILSGCERNGKNVTDGIIVIRGEVMPFEGGTAVDTITVIEEGVSLSADGMDFDNARVKRSARFASGTGDHYYPWADFKPLSTNAQLEEVKATIGYVDERISGIHGQLVPTGVIVMWNGKAASVPSGWQLCDGSLIAGTNNRTPDLRGRFIVGYNPVVSSGYSGLGNGSKGAGQYMMTLGNEHMPRHRHLSGIADNGDEIFREQGSLEAYSSCAPIKSESGTSWFKGYTSMEGSGLSFDLRPPYYVLAFIMKID